MKNKITGIGKIIGKVIGTGLVFTLMSVPSKISPADEVNQPNLEYACDYCDATITPAKPDFVETHNYDGVSKDSIRAALGVAEKNLEAYRTHAYKAPRGPGILADRGYKQK
jgi:hypothetical protein